MVARFIPLGSEMSEDSSSYIELAAEIVAAYVSNNPVRSADLSELITTVHGALSGAARNGGVPATAPDLRPAISVKKSITPDYIICLEDGKRFKSLKRHLRTAYSMTPEQYRLKWSLPSDYPMVAPSYAEARSNLAKSMGLGQKRPGKDGSANGRRSKKSA